MAGSIFYSLLIQYYYGYGDSFGFYLGGNVLSHMMQEDITSVKYLFASGKEIVAAATAMGFGDEVPMSMPNDSNAYIMKLSALLSFFTFNKYILISICFGFFSFVGIWKLFYVFYELNNRRHVRILSFFVLFFPSLWIWGSGLLKEPVCVGALGIIVYLLYKNFVLKKFSLLNMVVLLLLFYMLTVVKSYVTVIFLISLFVLLIYKVIGRIKGIILRVTTTLTLILALSITFISIDVSGYIEYFVENSYNQIQSLQSNYQAVQELEDIGSKGAFLVTDLSPSFSSIVANSPIVIGSCLFRPFVWESKKVIIFFASLEALVTLLITLYLFWKTRLFGFFIYVFTGSILLFCFIFSILFALVVGYTTFNFGTLIRYKIIFLPFYYFMLVLIYTRIKERSKLYSSDFF
jgi:hypothetical protein